MGGRDSDVKELEAHLEAVREALNRARTAMKEAASAEKILTARIAELGKRDENDHALRRTRKETLYIALAGAGVALGVVALTVIVVLALRPRAETPAARVAPL